VHDLAAASLFRSLLYLDQKMAVCPITTPLVRQNSSVCQKRTKQLSLRRPFVKTSIFLIRC